MIINYPVHKLQFQYCSMIFRLAEIDIDISGPAQFMNIYINAQLLFIKSLDCREVYIPNGPPSFIIQLLQKCQQYVP